MQIPPHVAGARRYVADVPLFAVSQRQKGGVVIPRLHEIPDLSPRRHWELWFCHQAKREDEFPASVRAKLVRVGEARTLPSDAPPPVDTNGLRTDGPTIEEWVEAGYQPQFYPPDGWCEKPSAALTEWRAMHGPRQDPRALDLPTPIATFTIDTRPDDSAPGEVIDAQGLEPLLDASVPIGPPFESDIAAPGVTIPDPDAMTLDELEQATAPVTEVTIEMPGTATAEQAEAVQRAESSSRSRRSKR